jgi:hypothetical protein
MSITGHTRDASGRYIAGDSRTSAVLLTSPTTPTTVHDRPSGPSCLMTRPIGSSLPQNFCAVA